MGKLRSLRRALKRDENPSRWINHAYCTMARTEYKGAACVDGEWQPSRWFDRPSYKRFVKSVFEETMGV